ncbi:hypothetical protein GCM10009845_06500 [Pedococcus bigeumensis]
MPVTVTLAYVPDGMSPPAHVYAIDPGADPAAIAGPVESASAAATARDPRILRRATFPMSTALLSWSECGPARSGLYRVRRRVIGPKDDIGTG